MATIEETRTKYYHQEGIDALSNRLKSIYAIWKTTSEDKYPVRFDILGFPPLVLESKEQANGHINELLQILMVSIEEVPEETKVEEETK